MPLLLCACELTEVQIAPGRQTVVVQSVISRTNSRQFVILEYAQTGVTPGGGVISFPGVRTPVRDPISGATVTVEHLSPGPCAGQRNTFTEDTAQAGLYTGTLCGAQVGERLRLRVLTPAGELVTGETTIPGASARHVTVAGASARFELDTLAMHRERDTIRLGLTRVSGRALQVEAGNSTFPGDIALYLLTDSMGMAVPGNLVHPFEENPDAIFGAGRYYLFSVALADSNYFDFVRSRSDPFTGRGFLNRLNGGIGVFGSVESRTHVLRVVAAVDDPREGVYRITGTARGVEIDLALELYLNGRYDHFAAFAQGNFMEGPIKRSVEGRFGSFSAPQNPDEMHVNLFTTPPGGAPLPGWQFEGVRSSDGSPFPIDLIEAFSATPNQPFRATLMAQQIVRP